MTEIELPAWASKKENYAPDSDRDFFLSADEAKDYGIVDQVMPSRR